MEAKPKTSRQKAGRKKRFTEPRRQQKGKGRQARAHSITLADIFLWITVVDECLYHPMGAFDRAAKTEGYGSVGNVVQRLKVLEDRFGTLFMKGPGRRRYRTGVPTARGAALAEIFVLIEHLFSWALSLKTATGYHVEVRKLKELILYLVPINPLRPPDQDDSVELRKTKELILYLGRRFRGSNHIRRPRRACRTRCG
jgi:hypothetical protein